MLPIIIWKIPTLPPPLILILSLIWASSILMRLLLLMKSIPLFPELPKKVNSVLCQSNLFFLFLFLNNIQLMYVIWRAGVAYGMFLYSFPSLWMSHAILTQQVTNYASVIICTFIVLYLFIKSSHSRVLYKYSKERCTSIIVKFYLDYHSHFRTHLSVPKSVTCRLLVTSSRFRYTRRYVTRLPQVPTSRVIVSLDRNLAAPW